MRICYWPILITGLLLVSRLASATEPGVDGLSFSVGEHGLDSLGFNGQSLLASSREGELQPAKSIVRAAVDALFDNNIASQARRGQRKDTIELDYSWGHLSCAYSKRNDNCLVLQLEAANQSSEIVTNFSARLFELTFPDVPEGATLEAGMFGFGFKGTTHPLYQYPLVADPISVPPIVRVNYRGGALNFCSDNLSCRIEIPYTTNPSARTRYPFVVTGRALQALTTSRFTVSLRFGPESSTVQQLSQDVLVAYAKKFPSQLNWSDHRPIGSIFLAGSAAKVATNPRHWIMNSGNVDVMTDPGRTKFRTALLKLADESVEILKETNAQGMITWDPEGEEFRSASYYGDPRLVPTLAPEMEFKGNATSSTIDAYFDRFRAAGLKVGICIRPQQIAIRDSIPVQQETDDERAVKVLQEKIAYARKRWGCTLFYVDSTVSKSGSLSPDVFKSVVDQYPDALLIPENESMRYFAYSAPFNSYAQHRITSTPAGARAVYPKAFSVLMIADNNPSEDDDALVEAVRNGDILLFNCWYRHPAGAKVKTIYEQARK